MNDKRVATGRSDTVGTLQLADGANGGEAVG
jgi:hypothetical protein